MKTHTNNYKNEIKELGRQITSKITYGNVELGDEELNSITPSYQGAILKSVMKQLDIDSNVDIPIETEINYQFGLLVGNAYEYLNFGNYIVYSSEKQEDTNSYHIIAYDKMLYAMKDYENMNITYPITIRNYINTICNHLGLTFANASDTFANYNKEIAHELYLNTDNESIGYTYRDVFDELAQVTATTICINDDDELEIRYVNQARPDNYEIEGASSQNGTPTPSNPNEIDCKTGIITETIDGKNYTFNIGNIKLDGIGVYKDRIYKLNNKWYLEKQTTRITFTGAESESWNYYSSKKLFGIALNHMPPHFNPTSGTIILSNKLQNLGYDLFNDYAYQYEYGMCVNANYILIRNKNINNVNDFKTWLSNNNIEILYPSTYNSGTITTEITDESLLSQLETETFDEEYLKNVNVNFGEKYGPVNSIVLSRAESDKVYLQDDESIEENGLCEICINDNQIMNGDDRSDYLPDILEQLDGLEYYLNDFSSTGITYLDVCDGYYVKVGETSYPCVMLNDEINVTQGLQEYIYTDRLEESETDYKKADKTDRKINQTQIVVDKHNQEISTLITYVGDRSEKTTSLTQDVDGLISQVSNIPNIITEGSGYGEVSIEDLENTKLAMLKVHPTSNVDIIRNVASTHLKVKVGNKVGHRGLTFTQEEVQEFKLPTNLYFYDNNTYDEFILDAVQERMYVIRRVGWNNDTKYKLSEEIIEEYTYQDLIVEEGDLTITYSDFPTAYIYVKAMIKNVYTETFATELELKSVIEQTANSIGLSVQEFKEGEQVNGATILAQINNDESEIKLEADKININGVVSANGGFKIDTDGTMEAFGCRLGGYITLEDGEIYNTSGTLENKDKYSQRIGVDLFGLDGPSKYDSQGTNIITKNSVRIYPDMFTIQNKHFSNWYSDDIPTSINELSWDGYELYVDGDLTVTGSKNRVVETNEGKVKLNAYETAEAYFGDLGSEKTNSKGECKIDIEDIFKQTIELDNYKVFIQELGNGKLYVEKHDDYFIVKGTPNLEFDYEIKAKQKGYANIRLERSDK